MKKIIIGALIALMSLTGCSGWKNSTGLLGVKMANEKLAQDSSPVRYTSEESEYGVNSQPYLLGKISSSVADAVLKQDVLKLIMQKENTSNITLVQTRFLSKKVDPFTVYEIWIIKGKENNDLDAYTVKLINSPQGGVDIILLGAARVYKDMLKEEKVK